MILNESAISSGAAMGPKIVEMTAQIILSISLLFMIICWCGQLEEREEDKHDVEDQVNF